MSIVNMNGIAAASYKIVSIENFSILSAINHNDIYT